MVWNTEYVSNSLQGPHGSIWRFPASRWQWATEPFYGIPKSARTCCGSGRCEAVLRLIPLFVVGAAVISVALVWILPDVLSSVKIATIGGGALITVLAVARQNLSLLELDRLVAAEQHLNERTRELQASNSRLATINEELVAATERATEMAKIAQSRESSEERISRQHES